MRPGERKMIVEEMIAAETIVIETGVTGMSGDGKIEGAAIGMGRRGTTGGVTRTGDRKAAQI